MNVICCSVTAAGSDLAGKLPYAHRAGRLIDTVRSEWDSVDGFVLFCATGIAVRAVAPLVRDKSTDPAIVCVDDTGKSAIALCGGHAGGANDLARDVAALLGAEAVVSTATDIAGIPALDHLPRFKSEGDIAGVTRRWLDGERPSLRRDPRLEEWPARLDLGPDGGPGVVLITDGDHPPGELEVVLRPPSLVIGTGSSTGADPEALSELVRNVLSSEGLHPASVGAVATLDRKADEPAIASLADEFDVDLVTFNAEDLAAVHVPNPSQVVDGAVGTPSVAEAAAVLAAGPGARLVAEKVVSASSDSTVAIARRLRPAGGLSVVGLGPGGSVTRTPEAAAAVRHADVVIGYGPYVDQVSDLLGASQSVIRSEIGSERERCMEALRHASEGATVALVCSGDPGVYAMASLVLELTCDVPAPAVTIVPGVTAALEAAAILGAPLGHDHASVSLSDLLTPWTVIERRLRAVADGDFVVSIYNPRSSGRRDLLAKALSILAARRSPDTPAAIVTDAGRPAETIIRTTLEELDPTAVSMRSLVIVGSSATRWIGRWMVTPRGYEAGS